MTTKQQGSASATCLLLPGATHLLNPNIPQGISTEIAMWGKELWVLWKKQNFLNLQHWAQESKGRNEGKSGQGEAGSVIHQASQRKLWRWRTESNNSKAVQKIRMRDAEAMSKVYMNTLGARRVPFKAARLSTGQLLRDWLTQTKNEARYTWITLTGTQCPWNLGECSWLRAETQLILWAVANSFERIDKIQSTEDLNGICDEQSQSCFAVKMFILECLTWNWKADWLLTYSKQETNLTLPLGV